MDPANKISARIVWLDEGGGMTETSDDDLIGQYLAGDGHAFEVLFERWTARLLGFVRSLGAGGDAAEDIVQATWLKALDALPEYAAKGRFQSWLFTIAHRVWLDHLRSPWEKRRNGSGAGGIIAAIEDTARDPRQSAVCGEQAALLELALAQLPPEQREVVLLRIDGDLSFREIAGLQSVPLGTALWRMNKARQRLRQILENATKESIA
jgi:RNA polymerase sigma-70 factor (ECF subfamily)